MRRTEGPVQENLVGLFVLAAARSALRDGGQLALRFAREGAERRLVSSMASTSLRTAR